MAAAAAAALPAYLTRLAAAAARDGESAVKAVLEPTQPVALVLATLVQAVGLDQRASQAMHQTPQRGVVQVVAVVAQLEAHFQEATALQDALAVAAAVDLTVQA